MRNITIQITIPVKDLPWHTIITSKNVFESMGQISLWEISGHLAK